MLKVDNAADCLQKLLSYLEVSATKTGVRDALSKHPNHPSLLAFSDVLNAWGVSNAGYKVTDKEISDLPVPFLAHTVKRGQEFVLVTCIDEQGVHSESPAGRPTVIAPQDFQRVFTGYVLLAQPRPGAAEPAYKKNRRKEVVEALRLPAIFMGCLLLTALAVLHSIKQPGSSQQLIWVLAVKGIGVILSVLLLIQSLGFNSSLVNRLCGSDKKKDKNCHNILTSEAAKLTDEVSWAEVGFFYFLGTWLGVLSLGGSSRVMAVLAMVATVSLCYTVYSIYYQAKIAKQWCVLCCGVQLVLWLDFLALLPTASNSFDLPSINEWTLLLGCLLAPVVCWVFTKPFFVSAKQLIDAEQQLTIFKRNETLFRQTLAAQPCFALLPPEDAIRLGNLDAKTIVTIVSNPGCAPCGRAHLLLTQWLEHRADIQVQVVFAVTNDAQDERTRVASHLVKMHRKGHPTTHDALHAWYAKEQSKYDAWVRRFPILDNDSDDGALYRHLEWCYNASITSTPTIMVNGQPLPKPFQLEDIQYFL